MPTPDDFECDVTDSASPTAVPSIHETTFIPAANGVQDIVRPLSHIVSAQAEAQPVHTPLDIEHVFVQDDPREWSRGRKIFTLTIISAAALIATLGINIYNPAISEIKAQLHATDQEISLTLSILILLQGLTPLGWSAMSEILGRKIVYLTSIMLYVIATGIGGSAQSVGVLIAMRTLQGIGGSAVITIGAATLADIYEPRQRGTVVGIYYAAPLLGPAIGPIIGGILTQFLSWRATFYFIAIFASINLLSLLLFRDTFRQERSLIYQRTLHRREDEKRTMEHAHDKKKRLSIEKKHATAATEPKVEEKSAVAPDPEMAAPPQLPVVRLSIRDINPVTPLVEVLRRRNNLAILFPSGLLFGLTYCITYTIARTFAAAPYNYGALDIGLVLLSYGIGCISGSIFGGRWSDHTLRKRKVANGGYSRSEDRLHSTIPMLPVLPLSHIAYAWMVEKKVNVGGICVVLFIAGVSTIWIYSSSLAYIVDANAGRSSTAVASSSFVRGFMAFISAEIAVPLQDALGDGWLYTLWAGLMLLVVGMLLLTMARGAKWREQGEAKERERERRREESQAEVD